MSSFTPPPTLAERHSGIPERLLAKATAVKRQTEALQTTSIVPRPSDVELPVIPKGYPRARFNKAIAEIRSLIGADNVKLNIDPLVDGWFDT